MVLQPLVRKETRYLKQTILFLNLYHRIYANCVQFFTHVTLSETENMTGYCIALSCLILERCHAFNFKFLNRCFVNVGRVPQFVDQFLNL